MASAGRVAVIGAGPAGVAAVAWLEGLAVIPLWFESGLSVGGTLLRVGNPLLNAPPLATATGVAWADALADYAGGLRTKLTTSAAVTRVRPHGAGVSVVARGVEHSVEYAIVCSGTRPRLLGLENEALWLNRGVEISVTRNLGRYSEHRVAVVGGGDAALEGALLLAEFCPVVHLVHRRAELRGQPRFVDAVMREPKIVRHVAQVAAIRAGAEGVTGLRLDNAENIDCSGVFVRIGVEPAVPAGLEELRRDAAGYLVVDRDGVTSHPRVFAAGDVASSQGQSVMWAAGSGSRAAEHVAIALGAKAARQL